MGCFKPKTVGTMLFLTCLKQEESNNSLLVVSCSGHLFL